MESIETLIRCPISYQIFNEPVILSDGQTYEKMEIDRWLKTNDTSPLTGNKLKTKDYSINYSIKNLVNIYLKDHPDKISEQYDEKPKSKPKSKSKSKINEKICKVDTLDTFYKFSTDEILNKFDIINKIEKNDISAIIDIKNELDKLDNKPKKYDKYKYDVVRCSCDFSCQCDKLYASLDKFNKPKSYIEIKHILNTILWINKYAIYGLTDLYNIEPIITSPYKELMLCFLNTLYENTKKHCDDKIINLFNKLKMKENKNRIIHLICKNPDNEKCVMRILDIYERYGLNLEVSNYYDDIRDSMPIHYICKYQNEKCVMRILDIYEQKKLDFEVRDYSNNMPIHLICIHQNENCVMRILDIYQKYRKRYFLFKFKPDITSQIKDRSRPIHLICKYQNEECIMHILKIYEDFKYSFQICTTEFYTPIHYICRYQNENCVMRVLDIYERLKLNFEFQNENNSMPIHYICRYQNERCVMRILNIYERFELDFEVKNNNNWAPIHYICRCQNKNCVMRILDIYERFGFDFGIQNDNNSAPIHLICRFQDQECVMRILDIYQRYNFYLNVKNGNNLTPRQLIHTYQNRVCLDKITQIIEYQLHNKYKYMHMDYDIF